VEATFIHSALYTGNKKSQKCRALDKQMLQFVSELSNRYVRVLSLLEVNQFIFDGCRRQAVSPSVDC